MKLLQYGYKYISKLLFLLPAEAGHKFALESLKVLDSLNLLSEFSSNPGSNLNSGSGHYSGSTPKPEPNSCTIAGLVFKNKLGIAAGLDKNGDYIAPLASLGVGFIELGTVTPLAQVGNPKPRLFRLKSQQAVINRMGFNNKGIDNLINNLKTYRTLVDQKTIKHKQTTDYKKTLIGINIGKNFSTPIENAIDDYLICLKKAYPHADYITINISSPNTQNLRNLQDKDNLDSLLSTLKSEHLKLQQIHNKYVPLALKISPDLSLEDVQNICDLCKVHKIDFIIATNTTNQHDLLIDKDGGQIAGGLSGKPLISKSNRVLELVAKSLRVNLAPTQPEPNSNSSGVRASSNQQIDLQAHVHAPALIGVGGINSLHDAELKFNLGADLIQIYTGLVYQGPALITNILQGMQDANKTLC